MARRPEHSFMQQSLVASFMEQDENLSVLGKSKINASRIGGQAKFDLTKPDMSIRGNATGDLFLLCLNLIFLLDLTTKGGIWIVRFLIL
jgi:hypothetical protein